MSIESDYKNRDDLNLLHTKTLQASLSQQEHAFRTRATFLSPTKDHQRRERSKSRSRTQPISPEKSTDIVAELISKTAPNSNKQENQIDTTTGERRYSNPQLHLSTLFPQAFRNHKHLHHHNRTIPKDETNAIQQNPNYGNAPFVTSFNQLGTTSATKVEPPFSLRSPPLPTSRARINPLQNSELILLPGNEDLAPSSSFIYEENPSEPRSAELFIIESRTPICVSESYRDHFFDYFHTNYYGEFDYEGPFITSLRCSYQKAANGDVCEARAIIRTQSRNYNVSDIINGTNENNILQMLFHKVNLPPVHTYGTIGDPKANEKLYAFDKTNDERFNCKIGVIYQCAYQTDEYEIFSNDHPSMAMLDFLDLLADRVRLKGFQKYRGDLDIKEDLHGEHSYHTIYQNHEIMFNVAPLVPSTKANRQCIERKSLVGNAFVCIVFQDAGAVFSPDFIAGKVTQIYITVQPLMHDNELYYKIGIWRRNDITSVVDPPGGTYKADKSFLPYFLTLILNAVNVAIESPSLRARIYEQRQRMKYEELKKLCALFSLGPLPDFNSDTDSIHSHLDTRSSVRSDSSVSAAITPTNENVNANFNSNSNAVRTSPPSAKKKGFSRKIFGVFSSRSASLTSPNPPANDAGSISSQAPLLPDAVMSLARTNVPLNKENVNRQRMNRSHQTPTHSFRSIAPQSSSAQPSISIMNPHSTDSLTQTDLINAAALNVPPRNRSNSSPDDTANSTKFQSYLGTKITEEQQQQQPKRQQSTTSSSSSSEQESSSESSEDDTPTKR